MTPDPRSRRFRLPARDAARRAADVDAELEFHLQACAQELVAQGWTPDAAHAEAARRFGDLEYTRRYCRTQDAGGARRVRLVTWLEELAHDARYALRQLRAAPAFAAVALLTLALGIGANTAIFSVVYGVLLRPLPYAQPEQLVRIFETYQGSRNTVAPPNFLDWRAQSTSFTGLAALADGTMSLTRPGADPERVPSAWVSANLLDILGTRALLGRTFASGEDAWGAPHVVVLDESLWRRAFGADPAVLGRQITLEGEAYTVIGIVPHGTGFPSEAEIFAPLAFDPAELPDMRGAHWLRVVGRLKPGVTVDEAASEMATIMRRLEQRYPDKNTDVTSIVMGMRDVMTEDVRTPLLVLLGAVGLVLLIACVNVANLLLARGVGRGGEIAVRAALGAGRGRIARQLVTESLTLALLGGALGVGLAVLGTKAFVHFAPGDVPRLDAVRVDGMVLLATLAMAVLVGALAGLGPALQSGRADLNRVLREGGRGAVGRRLRAVEGLAVAEMALAVTLLVGAGLLVRSFDKLRAVDPGFRPERVLTFDVALPEATYGTLEQQRTFVDALLTRARALPGARQAAAVFGLPMSGLSFSLTFEVDGRPAPSPAQQPATSVRLATPDYFAAMGIPLIRGRAFTDADRAGAPPVLVINETAARRFFPNGDAIGQRVTLGMSRDSARLGGEIVGVVGDVRDFGLDVEVQPQMYAPFDQWPMSDLSIVVRTAGEPTTLAAAVRRVVRELDPALPVARLTTLEQSVAESVARPRFYMLLLGSFAASALVLAAVGVYGVIAYAVGRRTREIGVRLALGATATQVLRSVVGRGLVLGLAGLVLGALGATAAARSMRGLLFGIEATDPLSFMVAGVVLLAVAVAAAWVPARRAARVSPVAAMRAE
ncbi:MAG TPA: ABC transporter permease [Gemmatimonadaceae bacterium]|nr:ABC transporter permease [Gemmatimonadaceae bacterium]